MTDPKSEPSASAEALISLLDEHLWSNYYGGLEISKSQARVVTSAIERLRAALTSAPAQPEPPTLTDAQCDAIAVALGEHLARHKYIMVYEARHLIRAAS